MVSVNGLRVSLVLAASLLFLAPIGHAANVTAFTNTESLPFSADYSLSCNSTTAVGAYSPASASDATVEKVGTTVFQSWWQSNLNNTCAPANAVQSGSTVTQACSQVVAGMNYAVLVDGFTVCPSNDTADPEALMGLNVTIAAKVYQPLGTAPSQITLLKTVSIEEEDF